LSVSAVTTESRGFSQFLDKHAVKIGGYHYLTHTFTKDILFDYILAECSYLVKNPGSSIILKLENGWFDTTTYEVVTSEKGEIIINTPVIDTVLFELKTKELRWIGLQDRNGEWMDMVYGALH
jgi:hypothetical protein